MKINDRDIDISELTDELHAAKDYVKMRGNGIYLSDNSISVLLRYGIDYKKYSSLNSLIFDIESILNSNPDLDDLDEVSSRLSEINYYNNTNK